MKVEVKIKKLTENAIIPKSATEESGGLDLYACFFGDDELKVAPAQTLMMHTGIAIAIPKGYIGCIFARSGISAKRGLRPANCVGVIDSDYRGEVMVALHNDSCEEQRIENNERIAQLVIMPYLPVTLNEVKELDETNRGDGGFGSSGRK